MVLIKNKQRKRNAFLEGLYEMAHTIDEEGNSKLDEEKFRREMDKQAEYSKNFMRKNKDIFEESEPKIKTCLRYDPCPICEKCKAKASHLYVSCQTCQIPICVHDYKRITAMIKRKNFIIKIQRKEFKNAFIKTKEEHFKNVK